MIGPCLGIAAKGKQLNSISLYATGAMQTAESFFFKNASSTNSFMPMWIPTAFPLARFIVLHHIMLCYEKWNNVAEKITIKRMKALRAFTGA